MREVTGRLGGLVYVIIRCVKHLKTTVTKNDKYVGPNSAIIDVRIGMWVKTKGELITILLLIESNMISKYFIVVQWY